MFLNFVIYILLQNVIPINIMFVDFLIIIIAITKIIMIMIKHMHVLSYNNSWHNFTYPYTILYI